MSKLILFLLFIFTAKAYGQITFAPITIHEKDAPPASEFKHVVLKTTKYNNAFFAALKYYPELKNVRIKVVTKKLSMLMQVRPTIWSSVRRPLHRKYKVFVNSYTGKQIPLPDVFTFNAQVGVFGHELAHISDYLTMRFMPLVKTAKHYRKNKNGFKKQMEQKTDRMTLEHGLGWQLYDYAVQWNKLPSDFDEYIQKKKNFYINSVDMLGIMLTMGYN